MFRWWMKAYYAYDKMQFTFAEMGEKKWRKSDDKTVKNGSFYDMHWIEQIASKLTQTKGKKLE